MEEIKWEKERKRCEIQLKKWGSFEQFGPLVFLRVTFRCGTGWSAAWITGTVVGKLRIEVSTFLFKNLFLRFLSTSIQLLVFLSTGLTHIHVEQKKNYTWRNYYTRRYTQSKKKDIVSTKILFASNTILISYLEFSFHWESLTYMRAKKKEKKEKENVDTTFVDI